MKGGILRIIAVGKLKNQWWRAAAAHYLELVRRWRSLECVEARDGDSFLPVEERIRQEGERILKILGTEKGVALSERGQQFTSEAFAALLGACQAKERLTFIIGGPFGLDKEVLDRCRLVLSLSAMTWPHELARTLLLEQIYRGESILRRLPYHHS